MRRNGFTLVEVLVVLGLLALMMAALLSHIGPGQQNAQIAICRMRLQQFGSLIQGYEANHQRLPAGGGARFLHAVWKSCDHGEDERDLFLCPACQRVGLHAELEDRDSTEIWQTPEELDADTDWTARSARHKLGMKKSTEIIVADRSVDHHGGKAINVLYGNGRAKTVWVDDLVKKRVLQPGEKLRVGPDSQWTPLQKVDG